MKAKVSKPTWTWADYHRLVAREKRAAERKAARAADTTETVAPDHVSDARKKVRTAVVVAPGVSLAAALVRGKIDITRAPSSMEGRADHWAAESPRVLGKHSSPAPARNQVLCRCGSRAGKGSGFVPSWFGDKCIEGDCPLRCIAKRKVA